MPDLATAPSPSPALALEAEESTTPIRWGRVVAARAKVNADGYDHLTAAELEALLLAVMQDVDNAPTW